MTARGEDFEMRCLVVGWTNCARKRFMMLRPSLSPVNYTKRKIEPTIATHWDAIAKALLKARLERSVAIIDDRLEMNGNGWRLTCGVRNSLCFLRLWSLFGWFIWYFVVNYVDIFEVMQNVAKFQSNSSSNFSGNYFIYKYLRLCFVHKCNCKQFTALSWMLFKYFEVIFGKYVKVDVIPHQNQNSKYKNYFLRLN